MIKRILAFLLLFTSIALAQSVIPGFPPGVFKSRNAIDANASGPVASGWDLLGHGTDISLSTTSVSNDTAVISTSSFEEVRGTSCKTTGKFQFEIKVLVGNDLMFGLLDQTTSGGSGMNGFSTPNGMVQWVNNFLFPTGADFSGTTAGSVPAAAGDIFGVEADLTGGKVWFSKNGTPLSGDPVLGTGNTASIANNHLVCPSGVIGTNTFSIQLITGTMNFPVSGYAPWN